MSAAERALREKSMLDAKDACWEAADAFVVHQHAHRLDSSGQLVPLLIKGSDGVRAYMRQ
jgi:exosome complex RNA-binding protein Rrp42 (RNase PH superfamily)